MVEDCGPAMAQATASCAFAHRADSKIGSEPPVRYSHPFPICIPNAFSKSISVSCANGWAPRHLRTHCSPLHPRSHDGWPAPLLMAYQQQQSERSATKRATTHGNERAEPHAQGWRLKPALLVRVSSSLSGPYFRVHCASHISPWISS
jgi:hypothetical protein